MAISQFEEWLIGENVDGSRQYIVHTLPPRFIGEIIDNEEGGNDMTDFQFFDDPPADPVYLARLMREAGDAINEYDRNLENHNE
jgi:hypothetical protein